MRPLCVDDALAYLDLVKAECREAPDRYNQFLDIMKDFKAQKTDTPGVIDCVKRLFNGNNELIDGFNVFLPPSYHIEEEDVGPRTRRWNSQTNPRQRMPASAIEAVPEKEAVPDNGQESTGFDNAIYYVTTVRKRFNDDPATYKKFLQILQTYQKEQQSIEAVLEEVSTLFADHPDLLREFANFLPDPHAATATATLLPAPPNPFAAKKTAAPAGYPPDSTATKAPPNPFAAVNSAERGARQIQHSSLNASSATRDVEEEAYQRLEEKTGAKGAKGKADAARSQRRDSCAVLDGPAMTNTMQEEIQEENQAASASANVRKQAVEAGLGGPIVVVAPSLYRPLPNSYAIHEQAKKQVAMQQLAKQQVAGNEPILHFCSFRSPPPTSAPTSAPTSVPTTTKGSTHALPFPRKEAPSTHALPFLDLQSPSAEAESPLFRPVSLPVPASPSSRDSPSSCCSSPCLCGSPLLVAVPCRPAALSSECTKQSKAQPKARSNICLRDARAKSKQVQAVAKPSDRTAQPVCFQALVSRRQAGPYMEDKWRTSTAAECA
jgi:paired amphipathic helix protein Sin3a